MNLSKQCSKSEALKLQEALKIPLVKKKFEDPLTARKITESFKSPTYRSEFFEDPLTAINKLGLRSTDPQPDIPRK
jgi:hypothetical protein